MATLLNKHDFLDRVNDWARRNGGDDVFERTLELWNEEAVFPAAISIYGGDGSPPKWVYGSRHYRRALLILRLSSRGISRYAQIRAALWFLRMEEFAPVDDLASEMARLSKKSVAKISSAFDPGIEGIEGKKADTLIRQMGLLSPHLDVDGIKPSKALLLDGYQAGRFDREHQDIRPILENFFELLLERKHSIGNLKLPPLTSIFSGLMDSSDRDKNIGAGLILGAGPQLLDGARDLIWAFVNRLPEAVSWARSHNWLQEENLQRMLPAFFAVARAAKADPRWQIMMLAMLLRFEQAAPAEGRGELSIANLSRAINLL